MSTSAPLEKCLKDLANASGWSITSIMGIILMIIVILILIVYGIDWWKSYELFCFACNKKDQTPP